MDVGGKAKRAVAGAAVSAVIVLALFTLLRGCTLMPWAGSEAGGGALLTVSVTRDFGRVPISRQAVRLDRGDSAMDALKSVATVETDYGGGFVSSIEGLKSAGAGTGGNDWFYYVNGVLSGVGAAEYVVADGDFVWWDYHQWGGQSFIPAVVGSYPRPFTSGYSGRKAPTMIIYEESLRDAALQVGNFLESEGAEVLFTAAFEEQVAERSEGPVIVLSTVETAGGSDWLVSMIDRPGIFIALEGGRIVPLDSNLESGGSPVDISAAITATGSGMGDPSPTWLVLCQDANGGSAAARVMASEPRLLESMVAAALGTDGSVLPLPLEKTASMQ